MRADRLQCGSVEVLASGRGSVCLLENTRTTSYVWYAMPHRSLPVFLSSTPRYEKRAGAAEELAAASQAKAHDADYQLSREKAAHQRTRGQL